MPFIGIQPTDTFATIDKQVVTGDGSTAYTLDHPVSSANDLAVFVNNVRQEPAIAYTASASQITFTQALTSSDSCYIIYIGRTYQTGGAGGGTDFPFYKADGTSDIIVITATKFPFYKADGSLDNIGIS